MKILITGGAGFIGARLTEMLATAGHDVTIFDKASPKTNRFPSILGDVRDVEALSSAAQGQDVIYNLAAEHRDDVRPLSLYEEVNVGGAKNVVTAAERTGVEMIVFTSSVAVYGDGDHALTEDAPHWPINEYGRTKSLAEAEHLKWAKAGENRRLTIVRPSVVFGPGNRGNVYNLLRQISSGRFVMVGDGENRKSMAFVDNVAAFLAAAPDRAEGIQIYNYADKPDFDMNALVTLIREQRGPGRGVGLRLPVWTARIIGRAADVVANATGLSLPISAVRVEKFIANTEIDASRVHQTGFHPPVDLCNGLRKTIQAEFGSME